MKKILFTLFFIMSAVLNAGAQNAADTAKIPDKADILVADTTFVFAHRDTCDLLMDIYYPLEGSQTTIGGKEKPLVLYVFGGGFVSGERDAVLQLRYYKKLIAEGFRVAAIDYRLGLKSILKEKVSKTKIIKGLENALQITVEDLYAATQYLIDNGETLGIDPYNIVVAGSSAGAMAALQADYQMCNRERFKVPLPEGYRYKGIMSFSGGVFSREGKPKYNDTPAPTLLMHGTDDRIVNYKQIRFFNVGFFGSDRLVKILKKNDANYNIIRYEGNGHEVAASFSGTIQEQLGFIYNNVMEGKRKIVDAVLLEPAIDTRFVVKNYKDLYKKK